MLKEDQAAALLARCEALLDRTLTQVRGNLKRAGTRAAAIWELICIDAFSQVGPLEHEPPGHGSAPDIVLLLGSRPLWVEAAFLYPRFWKSERRERALLKLVYQEAARLNIPAVWISSRFFGDDRHPAGPRRKLPDLHEKPKVLGLPSLRTFFDGIRANPDQNHTTQLDPYTVQLTYDPNAPGPYIHGGGTVEEQPRTVEEHALFRVLSEKARQHRPDCPYVICIGSDQSRAISSVSMSGIPEREAVHAFLRREPRVSAVIAVGIESNLDVHAARPRVARARVYQNSAALYPLKHAHIEDLQQLDFNRWKFYFALEKWEDDDLRDFRRSGGPLQMTAAGSHVLLTVPSTVLVDCLAGRATLRQEYGTTPDDPLLKLIDEGWEVVGCSSPGRIEEGLSSTVTLELAPPRERVYSREGKC